MVRHDPETGQQRNCFQSFVADLRSCFARRFNGDLAVTFSRRRKPEEVEVVRIVGHWIEALGPALRDVIFVCRDRHFVAALSVGIAAHALIDARGMWTMWPAAGISVSRRSAAASALSAW